jgi:hypothetical protein
MMIILMRFMEYAVGMVYGGMIYIPNFMKNRKGVQAILRFCLTSLRGFNVGILMGRIYKERR